MRDFNDYKKPTDEKIGAAFSGDAFDMLGKLSAAYEGKSADEILRAIISEAEKGRRNGTLSDADIDNFAATVSPMLDEKQRKTLKAIVAKLKKIQ